MNKKRCWYLILKAIFFAFLIVFIMVPGFNTAVAHPVTANYLSARSKTNGAGFEHLQDKDSLQPIKKTDGPVLLDDDEAARKKGIFNHHGSSWRYWPLADEIFTIVSSVFLISSVSIVILILYMRISKTIKERKTATINKAFENFAGDILFEDDLPGTGEAFNAELQQTISKFENEYLQTPFSRQVVLKGLLNLHKNLSGETAGILENLYRRLGFYQDSLNYLHHKQWFMKARAITELQQMEAREAYRLIYANIHPRNTTLRFVVLNAVLSLKKTKHILFLSEITEEVSDWEQLNLLATLSMNMHLNLVDVGKLLGSMNYTVVQLGIKLIQHYNIIEESSSLTYLRCHPNEKVRIDAIRALSFLEIEEASKLLKEQFAGETPLIRLEILRAIGNLGKKDDIEWLEEITRSDNLEIAQEARYSIVKLGKEKKEAEEMWG
jgi:hypothetical protein